MVLKASMMDKAKMREVFIKGNYSMSVGAINRVYLKPERRKYGKKTGRNTTFTLPIPLRPYRLTGICIPVKLRLVFNNAIPLTLSLLFNCLFYEKIPVSACSP